MKKKMNICETPIPECELDTYEAVAYEEQFTFDDLKNVLTSNEIKMLRQHFIEGYSIKEISIANSMKIGTGTMKFSRMYKKIKNSAVNFNIKVTAHFFTNIKIQNVRTKIFMRVLNIANKLYIFI